MAATSSKKPCQVVFSCPHCNGTGEVVSPSLSQTFSLFQEGQMLTGAAVASALGIPASQAHNRLYRLTELNYLQTHHINRRVCYSKKE